MPVMPIFVAPHQVLKTPADKVESVSDDIRDLIANMIDTMYAARGIGLAAPQIGVLKRVVVMDVDQQDENTEDDSAPITRGEVRVFINPEVVWSSEEENVYTEGCLSIPGQYADVTRPKQVRVSYMDEHGKAQEIEADGLLATCLQHEIDHINGVLFTDHLSALKRDMLMRKLKKYTREHAERLKDSHVL